MPTLEEYVKSCVSAIETTGAFDRIITTNAGATWTICGYKRADDTCFTVNLAIDGSSVRKTIDPSDKDVSRAIDDGLIAACATRTRSLEEINADMLTYRDAIKKVTALLSALETDGTISCLNLTFSELETDVSFRVDGQFVPIRIIAHVSGIYGLVINAKNLVPAAERIKIALLAALNAAYGFDNSGDSDDDDGKIDDISLILAPYATMLSQACTEVSCYDDVKLITSDHDCVMIGRINDQDDTYRLYINEDGEMNINFSDSQQSRDVMRAFHASLKYMRDETISFHERIQLIIGILRYAVNGTLVFDEQDLSATLTLTSTDGTQTSATFTNEQAGKVSVAFTGNELYVAGINNAICRTEPIPHT